MNAFMVVVERAVRPVQAGPKKLLRVREELLAHLTSIYEEELARRGDESAARAEAVRRFGDPGALTVELRQSVTWSDRIDARLTRMYGWRPGDSAARYSARLALMIALVILPWLPLALVTAGLRRPHDETVPSAAALLRLFGGVGLLVPLVVFVLSLLSIRIRDAMFGAFGTPQSWRRVAGLAGMSLPAFPVLGLLFFQISLGNIDVMADQLTTTTSLVASAVGYLLVPVSLVWFVWKLGPDQIRHVEWVSLDIGG
ncbi:MAG TPA: permease prefix domain 1-containing protein [Urbifossiella sp.]|nr:permease prefix domain 1-containing protein [Urbifossiella sp.]